MFEQICHLQHHTQNIRNISIIAHVDHGKTTLTDQLISSNNIISKKLAGKLRYMDSMADEQIRGITMKSSSISIVHDKYLINLIDSPGHVEFSSEVQAALRLTDGALILIDVLEGFSSQTYTVLKQMFEEGLKGILILNKIDRLILEQQMDPEQAYTHLSQIIEQVNATLSSFLNEQIVDQREENHEFSLDDESILTLESNLYFRPEMNNVVFCSSLDSWGFTISQFTDIFANKLGCKPQVLQRYLWGNYYLKNKKIYDKPMKENHQVLFVDFILKNVWGIYQNKDNLQKLQQMAKALLIEGQINNYKTLISKWLPIDKIIFQTVIKCLPNPIEAQKSRINIITKKLQKQIDKHQNNEQQYLNLYKSIENCDPKGPLIIFIAKMVNVTPDFITELPEVQKAKSIQAYAFARVFSGTIQRGQKLYVIGPKSKIITNQEQIDQTDINQVQVQNIYLMMASYLEGTKQIPAGNLVAIGGLDDLVFKTATLSDTNLCPSLTPVQLRYKSILKTTVNPVNMEDQPKLIQAIKKLYKSDPSLDVTTLDTGELVLGTCGNVHLQKCVTDIQRLCGCQVKVSDPIIPFKETIIYKNVIEESIDKHNKQKSKVLQKDYKQQQKQQKQQYQNNKLKDDDVDAEKAKLLKKQLLEAEDTEITKDTNELEQEDIRYNQLKEEEPTFKYSQQQEVKKIDHKNKGKILNKGNILLDVQNRSNFIEEFTQNRKISVKIRAIGLPFEFASWLEANNKIIRKLLYEQKQIIDPKQFLQEFDNIRKECKLDKRLNDLIENHLFCFGPKKSGPNLLIHKGIKREESVIQKLRAQAKEHDNQQQQQIIQQDFQQEQQEQQEQQQELQQQDEKVDSTKDSKTFSDTASSIAKGLEIYLNQQELTTEAMFNALQIGFDMALGSGPLCAEPIIGSCFIIESIKFVEEDQQQQFVQDKYGPISGQIISMMMDGCLHSFLGASPRLVESVYKCTMQTDFENYGKVLNVISQRRGKILSEILNNSTNLFSLSAHIPLSSSNDFYSALQTATHGHITAQLDFDGWVVVEEDPFYQPFTDDDIEEHGVQLLQKNVARDLITQTRKRKGMNYEEKVVVAADKERNLSKKK